MGRYQWHHHHQWKRVDKPCAAAEKDEDSLTSTKDQKPNNNGGGRSQRREEATLEHTSMVTGCGNTQILKGFLLVSACKSALDKLDSVTNSSIFDPKSPISGIFLSDAEFALGPVLAVDSAYPKVVYPAIDCFYKLFSLGIIHNEIDTSDPKLLLFKLVKSVASSQYGKMIKGVDRKGDGAVDLEDRTPPPPLNTLVALQSI
ncbi:hypothetical protein ACFX2C_014923 [Malus domestica]